MRGEGSPWLNLQPRPHYPVGDRSAGERQDHTLRRSTGPQRDIQRLAAVGAGHCHEQDSRYAGPVVEIHRMPFRKLPDGARR